MCDRCNCAFSFNQSFYHHYMQQHTAMTNYILRLNNIAHLGTSNFYRPANVYSPVDCSSCCSSCCSSDSCSEISSSSSEYEEEDVYYEESNEEEESECEYEFNVDAILAMRAAKEELNKEELPESKEECESKSDSIVSADSDEDSYKNSDKDSDVYDFSKKPVLDYRKDITQSVSLKFNRTEESKNLKIYKRLQETSIIPTDMQQMKD